MLKATFAQRGKILSLRLEGHAGYAEIGKDIVCASASILACTLAHIVKETDEEGFLVAPSLVSMDVGNAYIECEPKDEYYTSLSDAFAFANLGFVSLASRYPKNVEFIVDVEA